MTDLRDRVSTAMPQRVAERGRVRRRTRLVVLATVLTLVLLAGAAGWLVLGSSVLGARAVEVVGASRLTADEVVARAEVPTGTPLARLDTGAIADRVAGLAPVLRVSVDRDWPSTVRITVVERTRGSREGAGDRLGAGRPQRRGVRHGRQAAARAAEDQRPGRRGSALRCGRPWTCWRR